jgi:hypothetical protein
LSWLQIFTAGALEIAAVQHGGEIMVVYPPWFPSQQRLAAKKARLWRLKRAGLTPEGSKTELRRLCDAAAAEFAERRIAREVRRGAPRARADSRQKVKQQY